MQKMSPVLVNFLSLTTMENVLISINYSQKLISIKESIRTVVLEHTGQSPDLPVTVIVNFLTQNYFDKYYLISNIINQNYDTL